MTTTATDSKLTRLLLGIDGPVASITLRNPPLNVIDICMMEEIAQVVAEIEALPRVSDRKSVV